ncbi:FmdB family zinc ribbon protein [Thermodesulfobacteriota bacterium]
MPIFDFICKTCGNEFEGLVLNKTDKIHCPECESRLVHRTTVSLFSCTGVQVTKRLKLDSEERMNRGSRWMKKQNLRKSRIKIL